jgi:hypothetical protein
VSRATRASVALVGLSCLGQLVAWRAAFGQRAADVRLARLDSSTRIVVAAVVDSARKTRLPTEPLVDKALEGAQKGADGSRIVTAVRGLYAELRSARAALGTGAAAEEINAGANALHGGMPMRTLSQLRTVSQHAGRARVTLPLTVYTDLIARAVPPAVASDVVLSLARAGLRDGDYAMFQRNVRLDIENGADAATAAQTRARGAALRNVGR